MVATLQDSDQLAAQDGDGQGRRSVLGELVFAGLMFLPGFLALAVILWMIVVVVLH